MKNWTRDILGAMAMGLVLPGIILNALAALPQPQAVEPEPAAVSLPVLVRTGDSVHQADMDEYLAGVLLAEMPASFEMEALKAQAVVARTYARKAYVTGGKHGDGSVCTDPGCCQGYRAPEEDTPEKLFQAVRQTSGQVLTWEGQLIEATYFSCSGGVTEDAAAVWGTDFPYLRSVDSPGEENAAHYRDTAVFTRQELEEKLDMSLSTDPGDWLGKVTYTRGGSVDTALLGGQTFSGTALRQALGLRSAAFTISAEGDQVTFTTRGFGHRVGLSQYGADAMAVKGCGYEEILAHYYQGAAVSMAE